MASESTIVSVTARQVFTERGHPGVETTIVTQNGARGRATATAGVSVGIHEVQFAYDGGDRWGGRGVQQAVQNITDVIGPAITGMDASHQREVDDAIIKLDGTPNKANLGGNATASVSAAVLQAGAASLGIPLYRHIGGVNACILPVPGVITLRGSRRYGGGLRAGSKPTYSYMCYGFNSYSEASYAAWETAREYFRLLWERLNVESWRGVGLVAPGIVKHDRELWDIMLQAVVNKGYEGQIGFQVDVAASSYFEPKTQRYVGLFSAGEKSRDDLFKLYREMVANYPFVILEDPLEEFDLEGHAMLTRELGIEIVGDDLFTTNVERLQEGIEAGAANTVLLKVNQIGTITEAFDTVQLAYRHGYGVMPCKSRGEGVAIADYTVGLGTGHLREEATGEVANRFLEIEAELGSRAKFLGKQALKLQNH
ncbi:MAG: phosphopyruvate hydratase [Chloroflexi bacterium]|nr:MAG: phosphopyruvate hydratase [Chloroflexota bacterium]